MQYLKMVVALASASLCMGAAITKPTTPSTSSASSPRALISAANDVKHVEHKVKEDTLGLKKSQESFDKLGMSSSELLSKLSKATATFSSYKGNVSAKESKSLSRIFNKTASDVKAASDHLVMIAPKLKAAHVDMETKKGIEALEQSFGALGKAVASKLGMMSNSTSQKPPTTPTTPTPKTPKTPMTPEPKTPTVTIPKTPTTPEPKTPTTPTTPEPKVPKTPEPKTPKTPKTPTTPAPKTPTPLPAPMSAPAPSSNGTSSSASAIASSFSIIEMALMSVEKALGGT